MTIKTNRDLVVEALMKEARRLHKAGQKDRLLRMIYLADHIGLLQDPALDSDIIAEPATLARLRIRAQPGVVWPPEPWQYPIWYLIDYGDQRPWDEATKAMEAHVASNVP